jgi:hypothetical protein
MASQAVASRVLAPALQIRKIAAFPGMRVLAWDQDVLYASRGYALLKTRCVGPHFDWISVATYKPEWWRGITSQTRLAYRLVRDGFHALAVHPAGTLIAAVPGAIATLQNGEPEFRVTHRLLRGTRPLHICTTPDGRAYWGEYFDNAQRDEVHIYASDDGGSRWDVAYTFPKHGIRHVHNIVYDRWAKCLWIFTGDYGRECRILKASLDLSTLDEILVGNQQTRAVAVIVDESGLFFASDTPLEHNHVYHLDRTGRLQQCAKISSSSICGCRTRGGIFFSTMIEPSKANCTRDVTLYGSADGERWAALAQWRKDHWPMKYFQYGNAFLPDGENATDLLAVTTIAVENADLETSVWHVF